VLPLLFALVAQAFLAEPYVQLGERPSPDRLSIVWHAADADADWWVEHQKSGQWMAAARVTNRRIRVRGTAAFRVYEAELDQLVPGAEFDYRVTRGGKVAFAARAKALPDVEAPVRLAIIGDAGQGTRGQRRLAGQIHKAQPDAMLVTGDIVYPSGRLHYYREHWFPVYNNAETSAEKGAPLLRSRLSVAVPGNHDFEECLNLTAKPDGLAYFHVWRQPLNGPANTVFPIRGNAGDIASFQEAAGKGYPRAASFSFDLGPVHWTVIDSHAFMDWTRPDLLAWLEADLAGAKRPWKFVMLHHAPFHSTRKHAEQQRMRVLAPLFEKHGVKLVFAGHVHNYQRTHPIRFSPQDAAHPLGGRERIPGKVTRDEKKGVVYVVTGAGGAGLHDPGSSGKPQLWQEFTAKFEARQHSFSQLEATAGKVTLRQIGADGRELDFFELARE
jgi:acid phosphatase type 7